MFYIVFYVPKEHAEKVKESLFAAGAGTLGNYSHCSFESQGVGQFKPLKGSDPFMGTQGVIEKVQEIKVEMMCQKDKIPAAIQALKRSHPYEEPACYVIETVEY